MRLDDIELDDQLEWTDEFTWSAIEQETARSVSGVLLVQAGEKLHGRPITLASNGGAWTPLTTVRALEILRDQPGRFMRLQLPDGREFAVIFDHSSTPLECEPVERKVNPGADDVYEIVLRMLTVSPELLEP